MAKTSLSTVSVGVIQAEINRRIEKLEVLCKRREDLDRQIKELGPLVGVFSRPTRAPRNSHPNPMMNRRMGKTRNRFQNRVRQQGNRRHSQAAITAALNAALEHIDQQGDHFAQAVSLRMLRRESW